LLFGGAVRGSVNAGLTRVNPNPNTKHNRLATASVMSRRPTMKFVIVPDPVRASAASRL
jgi:hypothetical protein